MGEGGTCYSYYFQLGKTFYQLLNGSSHSEKQEFNYYAIRFIKRKNNVRDFILKYKSGIYKGEINCLGFSLLEINYEYTCTWMLILKTS